MPVARLLETVIPKIYHLELEPDLEAFRFRGHERLEFELVKASSQITLHAVKLDVTDATIEGFGTAVAKINESDQTVSLEFQSEIPAGAHTLELDFEGELAEKLHGFYRSTYKDGDKTKYLATTQFEAVHAREAFPCVDEPSAKAEFEVTMVVPKEMQAISNGAIKKETAVGEKKRVEFSVTPKMSTYLLAFLAGEFEYAEATTKGGVTVRVYATPGKKDQTGFALDAAVKTLDYYNEYFGIPYPLPKLDMIAIPDFGAGAMENWGAVTYRETDLLIDEKMSSLANRERVAVVVAHELAHQWFGNLVTMAWWNDLWLNEGFASFVEYLAVDHIFPEWQMWTQFVADDWNRAMGLDSLANTHPIEVEVNDPRELDEIFDAVSYSKGASIIRMLHEYLGETDFKKGLHDYLSAHSYGNTTTSDLWDALAKASGKPVAAVMGAWTTQAGFPIVSHSDGQLTQERFFASPLERESANDQTVWPIPVSALLADQKPSDPYLFEQRQASWSAETMIKLNPHQTAFYRVRYTQPDLDRMQGHWNEFEPAERLGIVSDVLAATEAGYNDSGVLLKLLSAAREEQDFTVWAELYAGLSSLIHIAEDEETRNALEQFGAWFVAPNLARLGWETHAGESHFDQLMRPMVLGAAGRFDDKATIDEARKRITNPTSLPADLRGSVYAIVARHGDDADYETFLTRFRQEKNPEEQMRIARALASFREPELLARTLAWSMSSDIRQQDFLRPFANTMMNRYGRDQAWRFLQDHWPELVKRYGEGGHMLEYLPQFVGAAFATDSMADEVEQFFAEHDHITIKRPAKQAVESIRLKANWWKRDAHTIKQFLAGR